MNFPDWRGLCRRRNGISETPPRAAEGLRQTGDRDRALSHLRPGRHHMVGACITNMFVNLVRDGPNVVLETELGDQRHLGASEHATRRIMWRVDDDRLGALVERLLQAIGVEGPVRTLEGHEYWRCTGENRIRSIILVEGLEHDHFVA